MSNTEYVFTRESLQDRAKQYLVELFGKPGEGNDPEKWMERYGLLIGFIAEQFPEPKQGHL